MILFKKIDEKLGRVELLGWGEFPHSSLVFVNSSSNKGNAQDIADCAAVAYDESLQQGRHRMFMFLADLPEQLAAEIKTQLMRLRPECECFTEVELDKKSITKWSYPGQNEVVFDNRLSVFSVAPTRLQQARLQGLVENN